MSYLFLLFFLIKKKKLGFMICFEYEFDFEFGFDVGFLLKF